MIKFKKLQINIPLSFFLLACLSSSAYSQTKTTTHQQGNSTNTVIQSGSLPSRTTVEKTTTGQKIITRSGNSTDVTIQDSRSAEDVLKSRARPDSRRSSVAAECITRRSDFAQAPGADSACDDFVELPETSRGTAARSRRGSAENLTIEGLEEKARSRFPANILQDN